MSGTITVDPQMLSLGALSPGDTRYFGVDFANKLSAGESLTPASQVVTWPGGTVTASAISGTQVLFDVTAGTIIGTFLVSIAVGMTGGTYTEQITRSLRLTVMTR